MLIYADGQTHQKFTSEPHKNLKKGFLFKYEFFGLIHFDLFFFLNIN